MLLRSPLARSQTAALVLAVLACSGCGKRAANASASVAPIAVAAAAETQSETDAGKGNGYTFQIVYPTLASEWKALDVAIREFAAVRKKDFLDASADADRVPNIDYIMDLKFAVARRTASFVSVSADGDAFMGGAHGMPILASFNLDLADGKLTTLPDLFADANAGLRALSDECRRQLEGRYEARLRDDHGTMTPAQQASDIQNMQRWIERGTVPSAANFSVFLIDGLDAKAIGLAVIFPPYQVAPYADGAQQVEVPAKVFYDLLKPEYKDAFAIDIEARKIGAGVR